MSRARMCLAFVLLLTLGRRLYFRWDIVEGGPVLVRLEDAASAVLATFTRQTGTYSLLLETASSAAGTETYQYRSVTIGGATVMLPHLTGLVRDGSTVVSVTYDADWPLPIGPGRVSSVQAGDGRYAFRYPGAANNTCPEDPPAVPAVPATRSTMIIDRSINLGIGCTLDADCAASGEAIAVCDEGACRAATCQQYAAVSGSTVVTQPVHITGNCPCGGSEQLVWTAAGAQYRRG